VTVAESFRRWYEKQDRISLLISLFVFLASLAVYLKTMAPTVSFWDCGEFIACSNILGIPHPPGSPLYILIGRIFSVIPLFEQIAARVNLLSAITSALTVWMIYLVIMKLTSRWVQGSQSLWLRMGRYSGGMVGAFFVAFSMTFWSNAVEAEVYGLSMLLMTLFFYLTLIWMDHRTSPVGDKLLVLIAYLALLSTGIHMTIFLAIPAMFILVVLTDREKLTDPRFWITGVVLAMVVHRVTPFLIALGIWLVVTLLSTLTSTRRKAWALCFLITCAGMMGYSTQLFIPIRSSLDPAIDENDPDDWASFKNFLERSQYGQQSMISRMFHRRGTWASQFGTKERMGFWGFFSEQYMHRSLWFIPIFLGLFGVWEQIRRRKREGVVLLILILACTAGLVFYMNFADGTQPDPLTREIIRLEVRDRDYFFSPGFMFFALAMGLGAFAVIKNLGNWVLRKSKSLQAVVGIVTAVLLVLPLLTLKKSFNRNDRTGNWIPYDYAYNHLMSCKQDAMLITNGDNDTFPLWFLQNVEKIRQDVRIVNLSLLNADWYILQLKDIWNVPINLKYEEIKGIPTKMSDGRWAPRPGVPYYDEIRKRRTYLFPYYDEKSGKVMRIQDQMLEQILLANQWRYPFYFSRTTPPNNRVGLDNHVIKEGLVDRLVPEEGENMIDLEVYHKNLWEVYQYRGLADMNVYKDDNTVGLLMNYSERHIELSDHYKMNNQTDKAKETLEHAAKFLPDYYRTYLLLYKMYLDEGDTTKANDLLDRYEARMETMVERSPEILLYYQYLGLAYQARGKFDEAERIMRRAYELKPTDLMNFQILRQIYAYNKDFDKLITLLEDWLEDHPDDGQSQRLLEMYRGQR
jgi:tetratricopeptide (TPR) repeat protein